MLCMLSFPSLAIVSLLPLSFHIEIIIHPQDTTVFPNQTATFKCVTEGADHTTFTLNGTGYGDLPKEIKDDYHINRTVVKDKCIKYTLNLTDASKYNGTTVQCVAYDWGGVPVKSENATLTIKGIAHYCCLHTIINCV